MRLLRGVGLPAACLAIALSSGCVAPPGASTVSSSQATLSSQEVSGSVDASASGPSGVSSTSPASVPVAVKGHLVSGIAGVALFDSDESVVKRFGRGFFTDVEGHAGGRYYVDPSHRFTLHVVIGTDSAIDGIDLCDGVYLPAGIRPGDDPGLVSASLAKGAGVPSRIRLGMTASALLKALGKPSSDERTGVQRIIVFSDETGDSNYWAQFSFVGDKLRSIQVSDSD
jgi:hypothetical protein